MSSSSTSLVENAITCPICLKHFDEPRMLPCKHTFCLQCIQQMISQNNGVWECPKQDGEKVEENDIRNLNINNEISKLIQLFGKSIQFIIQHSHQSINQSFFSFSRSS